MVRAEIKKVTNNAVVVAKVRRRPGLFRQKTNDAERRLPPPGEEARARVLFYFRARLCLFSARRERTRLP